MLDTRRCQVSVSIIHPDAEDSARPVSYSAFTSWLRCGKSYQLERILGIEGLPAWYFVGGSAVHTVTEEYDRHLYETEGR